MDIEGDKKMNELTYYILNELEAPNLFPDIKGKK